MILSPCSGGCVLSCESYATRLSTQAPENSAFVPHGPKFRPRHMFYIWCKTKMRKACQLRGEQMERYFLKVAVFLQIRSTALLCVSRVKNDLLSPQLTEHFQCIHLQRTLAGSLSPKPMAMNPLHLALRHYYKHSILKSSCGTAWL